MLLYSNYLYKSRLIIPSSYAFLLCFDCFLCLNWPFNVPASNIASEYNTRCSGERPVVSMVAVGVEDMDPVITKQGFRRVLAVYARLFGATRLVKRRLQGVV